MTYMKKSMVLFLDGPKDINYEAIAGLLTTKLKELRFGVTTVNVASHSDTETYKSYRHWTSEGFSSYTKMITDIYERVGGMPEYNHVLLVIGGIGSWFSTRKSKNPVDSSLTKTDTWLHQVLRGFREMTQLMHSENKVYQLYFVPEVFVNETEFKRDWLSLKHTDIPPVKWYFRHAVYNDAVNEIIHNLKQDITFEESLS